MKTLFRAAAAITIAIFATAAQAQTSGDDVSLGEEVKPQPGETYIVETIGAFEVRCVKMAEGQGDDPCSLYQLIKDDQGLSLAEVTLFPLIDAGQAVAGATVITPLGTLLTANLVLSIDGSAPKRYPYNTCTEVGCVSRIGFTAEELDRMKAGKRIAMTIVAFQAPDRPFTMQISLDGFTKGFEKISGQG